MLVTHTAHPTRNHYWLVIATNGLAFCRLVFKGAEITVDCRTTEFVVKTGSTDGAFQHDIQR